MKALNGKHILAAIVGAILITGCGNSGTKSLSAAPNGFIPSSTTSALSSQAQAAIFGNYGGTLEATYLGGGEVDSQAYTLTLGQAQINNNSNTYLLMTLTSNGSAFTITDQELLDFNPAGQATYSGEKRYVFYTTPHIISGLSNTAVQLEFDIYLNAANQVDSSQSQILIYDCGFANTCSTESTYADALFVGLAKH